jgi:hypothetical protein
MTAFINPSGTEAVRMPSFSIQRGYKMCKSRIIPSSGLLTWGVNKGYVTVNFWDFENSVDSDVRH